MLTLGTLIKSTEAAKRKEREKEKKEGGGWRVEGGRGGKQGEKQILPKAAPFHVHF